MLATIQSGAVIGVNAYPVAVEVDLSRGMMVFSTVGLPSSSVCEAKTRVKSALINAKESFPQKRVVVNLAPAHIKKEGTAYDLPIALGILVAHERIPASAFGDTLVVGELSLDGSLRAIRGVLPLAAWARRQGVQRLLVPEENGLEAIAVEGLEVWVARDLQEVIRVARGDSPLRHARPQDSEELELNEGVPEGRLRRAKSSEVIDMADVRGQEGARRALEVAAAGGHNLLFLGPPGSGKTMLARRLPSISPPLTFDERLESSIIASVSGLLRPEAPLIERRPFRAPHHTLSQVALAGGGPQCRPGEVSLAHNGVLFLDELPEFRRAALEVLRQPIEDGEIVIARALRSLTYPARFTLVAAMNPCPCGYFGHPTRECQCAPTSIRAYLNRISGPLLDRIDLQISVEAVDPLSLRSSHDGEGSTQIRERVCEARDRQTHRFKEATIHTNGQMRPSELRRHCQLDERSEALFTASIKRLNLSARAHDRVLKVSRTLADLAASEHIEPQHIAEAVQYRQLDRIWTGGGA